MTPSSKPITIKRTVVRQRHQPERGERPAARDVRPDTPHDPSPHLLLCPPDHFEVRYRINPWMHPETWSIDAARLSQQARSGWRALHDVYRRLGVRIETMPAQPGSPDLVFTANSAVVLDGKALLARFRNPERRNEEAHDRRAFEALRSRGIVASLHEVDEDVHLEGAGDAIWDAKRQLMWMGHGQRSDFAARDAVRRVFGVDTLSLELVSPSFYHLDTCLCVLPRGEVLWYPPAFSDESQRLLRAVVGGDSIEASDEDATRFAVNAVGIGDEIVLCHASPQLRRDLAEREYRTHIVALDAFNRSGGAACCLTLRLDHRSGNVEAGARTLAA